GFGTAGDGFYHRVRFRVDGGDGIAVGAGDVQEPAAGTQDHAAGVQAYPNRLRLLPLACRPLQEGDSAVVGDPSAGVDADRRVRSLGARFALLRRVAAPVADVGGVR